MTRALILVLLFTGCGGFQKWDRVNTIGEVAFASELAVDGYQTRAIVADCQEYNPVIGSCGDRMPWGVYLPTMLALHVVVSALLPPRARTMWQGATLGVEGHTIYYNSIVPDQHPAAARH